MSTVFDFDVLVADREVVIRIIGELDLATAPQLREPLMEALAAGARHVVVDVEDLDSMDSTGLGVIVGANERAKLDDGHVRVRNADAGIRKLFELTSVVDLLEG